MILKLMMITEMTIRKLNKSYNEQVLKINDESKTVDDSDQMSRLDLTPQAKSKGLDITNKTWFTDSIAPSSRNTGQFKFKNTNYDLQHSYFYEDNEQYESQKNVSYLPGLTDDSDGRSNTFQESEAPKTPKISRRYKQSAINNTISNLTKTQDSFKINLVKSSGTDLESIPIDEWYLSNCFTKQSEFSDVFGRKILHEVDWTYIDSRYWDLTHPYLRDKFYEHIFAYSLTENVFGTQRKTAVTTMIDSVEHDPEEFLRQTNLLIEDNNIIKNSLLKNYASYDISNSGKYLLNHNI